MEKFIEELKIRDHYTDLNGKLILKTLCDLFNDVANGQTLTLGFDVDTLNAQGLTWMLHKIKIQIYRMPEADEKVTLETWPSGIDRLFALRDFRMVSSEGDVIIRATSEWMVIDLARRRPVRLPECVMIYEEMCKKVVRDISFLVDVKNFHQEFNDERQFIATYDNIDFNKHVTQASYVRWITNSLPYEFLKNHTIKEIEIIYEHEVMPDQMVIAGYDIVNEEIKNQIAVYHRVTNNDKNIKHCIAKTTWI